MLIGTHLFWFSGSNVGIIVGVVVGGIVLAVLLLFALIFGFKHFRRRKLAKEPTMQQSGIEWTLAAFSFFYPSMNQLIFCFKVAAA